MGGMMEGVSTAVEVELYISYRTLESPTDSGNWVEATRM